MDDRSSVLGSLADKIIFTSVSQGVYSTNNSFSVLLIRNLLSTRMAVTQIPFLD